MDKQNTKNKLLWISIPTIIVVSTILLTFLIYSIEEDNIRDVLYSNQIEIQQTVTDGIASNVNSELQLIFLELTLLSRSNELQEDITGSESLEILRDSFDKINSITPISALFLTDKDATVLIQVSIKHDDISGIQLSGPPILEVQETLESSISSWLGPEVFGYQFSMIHPIIDEEDNSLKGMLVLAIPAEEFFQRHGNIYDVESRFLMALDKHKDFVVGPNAELIGENFQGEEYQKFLGENEAANSLSDSVFAGNSDYAIYVLDGEERITTGIPVSINDEDVLYIFVITPTSTISSQVDDIIATDKIITSIMLATIAGILILLFVRAAKNLEREKLVMIGKLSSNIAHDMRNPLGTIKSSTRRIEKHNEQDNQVINDETQRINRAINRMSHQVEQVLNYVRTTPIVTKKSSIKEMINYALESVEIPKNITVNVPQDDDVNIECDSEKLEIVFVNLLLNAVQAIDKGKEEINIRVDEELQQIIIEFENTGSSIPDDVLPKIFDPLFTTKLKGTGLGLSGCKNIIEQHKGTIRASSNPVIFKITLPKIVD